MASAKGQRNAVIQNNSIFSANSDRTSDILRTTSQQALDALGQGQGQARADITGYGNQALAALGQGRNDLVGRYDLASNQLNMGRDQAQSRLDTINPLFQPYSNEGAGAVSALGASLRGDNSGFNASDNYNFTRDEALRATTRQASATGRLDGGGTLAALNDRAAGLASGEINNWQNRLQGLAGMGLQANGAIAANTTNAANLDFQQGQGQAALQTGLGRALAGNGAQQAQTLTNLGSGLGNVAQSGGAQQAGVYSNLGNSLNQLGQYTTSGITSGIFEAGKASDAAKTANQNAMISAAGTGLSLLAGGFGGGGFGSLFGGAARAVGGGMGVGGGSNIRTSTGGFY